MLSGAVVAQEEPDRLPFEGGTLTITEVEGGEKLLAFDGRLIARNYTVFFDRVVEVAGTQVALVAIGQGGNACGTSTIVVWRGGTEVQDDFVGDDCSGPPPAVSDEAIYFVPYLLPGETGIVQRWTPAERLVDLGELSFAPQAGSTWADLDPAAITHPIDLLRNADVLAAVSALLGRDLTTYAEGLGTASMQERTDGLLAARGCVPHACGVADSFLAVDPAGRAVYLAKQGDGDAIASWPPVATWPAAAQAAMERAFAEQ